MRFFKKRIPVILAQSIQGIVYEQNNENGHKPARLNKFGGCGGCEEIFLIGIVSFRFGKVGLKRFP